MLSLVLPQYLVWFIHIIYYGCLWEILVSNPDSITTANSTFSPLGAIHKDKTQSREDAWCKWDEMKIHCKHT